MYLWVEIIAVRVYCLVSAVSFV